MKKKIIMIALICLIAMNVKAQIYGGDSYSRLPTTDLYDTGMMNSYTRALAETAAKRKENYYYYCDLAVEAYNDKQCNAYERLGNLKAAKKDYTITQKTIAQGQLRHLKH